MTDLNKTLLGFFDKDRQKYGILTENLPLFVSDKYSIFLTTQDYLYTIDVSEIEKLLINEKKKKNYYLIKKIISNILVIPGLISSIFYLLVQLHILSRNSLLSTHLSYYFFWIGLIGLISLWYTIETEEGTEKVIQESPELSQLEIDNIQINGFQFGRYAHEKIIQLLSPSLKEILLRSVRTNEVSSLTLLTELIETENVKEILKRTGLELNKHIFQENKIDTYTLPSYPISVLRNLLVYALDESINSNSTIIDTEHLFVAFLRVYPALQIYIQKKHLHLQHFRAAITFKNKETQVQLSIFNPRQDFIKKSKLAKKLIMYIPPILQKAVTFEDADINYRTNFNKNQTLQKIQNELVADSENNILLYTSSTTNEKFFIKSLIQNIVELENQFRPNFIKVNLQALLKKMKEQTYTEVEILRSISNLLTSYRVLSDNIVFIEDINTLLKQDKNFNTDFIQKLLEIILSTHTQIVFPINYSGFSQYFYLSPIFKHHFVEYEIPHIRLHDNIEFISQFIPNIEKQEKCFIRTPALISAITLELRYHPKDTNLPYSALETLKEAVKWAKGHKIKIITHEQIAKIISNRYNVPIETIYPDYEISLTNLEQLLSKRIVGQEKVVSEIIKAINQKTAINTKPISLLFIGPSGTGKTFTAKQLAHLYTNNNMHIIQENSLNWQTDLLTTAKTENKVTFLFENIQNWDIDKLDILLQIVKKGSLLNNKGEEVSFKNHVIVATIKIEAKQQKEWDLISSKYEEKLKQIIILLQQRLPSEVFTAFESIILFRTYKQQELIEIAKRILKESRASLKKEEVILQWEDSYITKVIKKLHADEKNAIGLKKYINQDILKYQKNKKGKVIKLK